MEESLILRIRLAHTITHDAVTFHGVGNAHAELEAELWRIVNEEVERQMKGGV